MKVLDWLLTEDESVQVLVRRHLLKQNVRQENRGYIQKYIDLYDHVTMKWGDGFYSPKWVSSTYTLLELVYMEVNPTDIHVQEGFDVLLANLWYTKDHKENIDLDLCIVGMLLEIGCYLHSIRPELESMLELILKTQNDDGGWNCYINRKPYKTSSLHTTINILDGLRQYVNQEYIHKQQQVEEAILKAEEFMLKKNLLRSRRTNELIHPDFSEIHYPVRWKYDAFRALEYFVDQSRPYDPRMEEALSLVYQASEKGIVNKGHFYTGKVHFDLGTGRNAINTYRVLKILKHFDPTYYKTYLNKEI